MTSKIPCSFCGDGIQNNQIFDHIEQNHVGRRQNGNVYSIHCGECDFEAWELSGQEMVDHCFRMNHRPSGLSTVWSATIEKETRRIKKIVANGMEVLRQSVNRSRSAGEGELSKSSAVIEISESEKEDDNLSDSRKKHNLPKPKERIEAKLDGSKLTSPSDPMVAKIGEKPSSYKESREEKDSSRVKRTHGKPVVSGDEGLVKRRKQDSSSTEQKYEASNTSSFSKKKHSEAVHDNSNDQRMEFASRTVRNDQTITALPEDLNLPSPWDVSAIPRDVGMEKTPANLPNLSTITATNRPLEAVSETETPESILIEPEEIETNDSRRNESSMNLLDETSALNETIEFNPSLSSSFLAKDLRTQDPNASQTISTATKENGQPKQIRGRPKKVKESDTKPTEKIMEKGRIQCAQCPFEGKVRSSIGHIESCKRKRKISHVFAHTREKLFQCQSCGWKTYSTAGERNHPKPCKGRATSIATPEMWSNMVNTLKQCFPDDDWSKLPRPLQFCAKGFKKSMSYALPMSLKCSKCPATFDKHRGHIAQHIAVHCRFNFAECAVCDKRFLGLSTMKSHLKTMKLKGQDCTKNIRDLQSSETTEMLRRTLEYCFPGHNWDSLIPPGMVIEGLKF